MMNNLNWDCFGRVDQELFKKLYRPRNDAASAAWIKINRSIRPSLASRSIETQEGKAERMPYLCHLSRKFLLPKECLRQNLSIWLIKSL